MEEKLKKLEARLENEATIIQGGKDKTVEGIDKIIQEQKNLQKNQNKKKKKKKKKVKVNTDKAENLLYYRTCSITIPYNDGVNKVTYKTKKPVMRVLYDLEDVLKSEMDARQKDFLVYEIICVDVFRGQFVVDDLLNNFAVDELAYEIDRILGWVFGSNSGEEMNIAEANNLDKSTAKIIKELKWTLEDVMESDPDVLEKVLKEIGGLYNEEKGQGGLNLDDLM